MWDAESPAAFTRSWRFADRARRKVTLPRSIFHWKRPRAAPGRIARPGAGILAATVFLSILLAPVCTAWAAGEAGAGRQLALRWCTGCHVVDAGGHGTDAAPPFATIAAKRHQNPSWLRAWLSAPHPRMPDVHLSNREIDDVVAYLNSLVH